MAWTTPATFTTGNVLTAAQMNTNVRDNTNFVHSPPGCLAQRTTTQSIANNTAVAASFTGTDIYDTDTMHDPAGSPTVITINTSGVYQINGSVEWTPNNTGVRRAVILMVASGVELGGVQDTAPFAGVASMMSCSGHYKFTSGVDTLNLQVFQTSGGALNLLAGGGSGVIGAAPFFFGAQWVSDGT